MSPIENVVPDDGVQVTTGAGSTASVADVVYDLARLMEGDEISTSAFAQAMIERMLRPPGESFLCGM